MKIGNIELTREQMPSYEDFNSNPKHLYNLMQDQLNSGLQVAALKQQQLNNAQMPQGNKQNGQK
jgi:hypothetical protein